jgi:hypothetical protein
MENKRDIMGRTFARRHNLDIDALRAGIANDEFSRPAGNEPVRPYSSLSWITEADRAKYFADGAA